MKRKPGPGTGLGHRGQGINRGPPVTFRAARGETHCEHYSRRGTFVASSRHSFDVGLLMPMEAFSMSSVYLPGLWLDSKSYRYSKPGGRRWLCRYASRSTLLGSICNNVIRNVGNMILGQEIHIE